MAEAAVIASYATDAAFSRALKYREAIVLRDFEEYSITEMAAALRLTRAAVKSRIHRGRQLIREHLAD